MAMPNRARGRFTTLTFPKTGEQIVTASKIQRDLVADKIAERKSRIGKICEDKGISIAEVFANLDAWQGNRTMDKAQLSGGTIQAGEMAQLKEEADNITSEKQVLRELTAIIDNLPAGETFKLDFSELEYFGF